MTSMLGTDLSTVRQSTGHCGPVHGAAATALFNALAEHFGLAVDQVRASLAPMFPDALPHLRTPAGWALFGAYMAHEVPAAKPFAPVIH